MADTGKESDQIQQAGVENKPPKSPASETRQCISNSQIDASSRSSRFMDLQYGTRRTRNAVVQQNCKGWSIYPNKKAQPLLKGLGLYLLFFRRCSTQQ